ncbi:DUF3226 domain-containing protein [Yersinia enterocolitica]
MNKKIPNLLLVEGNNDKSFFEKICKKYNINTNVQVSTPVDWVSSSQGGFNSKQGVINSLDVFLPMLEDEESIIKRIAIIIDSDIEGENKGGFVKSIEQITKKASEYDYSTRYVYKNGGVEIPHNDSQMNPLGIWIMPNNKDDGTIENWIKDKIINTEQEIFSHACTIVSKLKSKKFSQNSIVKAEIATWLAWQNQPGRTIAYALKEDEELIDINNSEFKVFVKWLRDFIG